ncbi:MAG: DUF4062 domain-containing protein [Acidobacteriota bacterium]
MDAKRLAQVNALSELRYLASRVGIDSISIPGNADRLGLALMIVDRVTASGNSAHRILVVEAMRQDGNDEVLLPSASSAASLDGPCDLFLSGTTDLNEYKLDAKRIIEGYGARAWMDPDERAVGNPRDICLGQVRSCRLFVLLMGKSYGGVVPDLGMSATEDEYEYAKRLGKPIALLVEKVPVRAPRQVAFLDRVRSYVSGRWRVVFTGRGELRREVRRIWQANRSLFDGK